VPKLLGAAKMLNVSIDVFYGLAITMEPEWSPLHH
jgi:hypothetical protein